MTVRNQDISTAPLSELEITLTSSRESSSSSFTDFRVDDRGGGSGLEH
jgi:hypothetical protein